MIFIAYHPCYELELPRGHRFPMDKYPMLRKQLIYEGTFSNENFFVPKKIDRNIVEKVHNKNKLTPNLLSLYFKLQKGIIIND